MRSPQVKYNSRSDSESAFRAGVQVGLEVLQTRPALWEGKLLRIGVVFQSRSGFFQGFCCAPLGFLEGFLEFRAVGESRPHQGGADADHHEGGDDGQGPPDHSLFKAEFFGFDPAPDKGVDTAENAKNAETHTFFFEECDEDSDPADQGDDAEHSVGDAHHASGGCELCVFDCVRVHEVEGGLMWIELDGVSLESSLAQ